VTAREEEFAVNLVHVGFELRLENSVGFVTLLSFKSMGDFTVMDGGDKPVSNHADRLVEVGLCGEDVDRGLRRYWGVIWSELSDCGRVGDGVEWDREDGQGRRSRGGRLIGQVDRRHAVVKKGVAGIDDVGEIGIGMELQSEGVDGE
jgi:hypothetical protein